MRRARVALLAGCAQQVLEPNIGHAALRVLAGRCRGRRAAARSAAARWPLHVGEERGAVVAQTNLRAFPDDVDAIVMTAAGCGSGLQDYPLAGPPVALDAAEYLDGAHEVGGLAGDDRGELGEVDRGAERLGQVVEARQALDGMEHAARLPLRTKSAGECGRRVLEEALEVLEDGAVGHPMEGEGKKAHHDPLRLERHEEARDRLSRDRLQKRVFGSGQQFGLEKERRAMIAESSARSIVEPNALVRS